LGGGMSACPSFPCVAQNRTPCSVSTSRSSNRTCRFAASGSRTSPPCGRSRAARRSPLKPNQPQRLVQVTVREACPSRPLHLVLPHQPPTEPRAGRALHPAIGCGDRPQTEIVRPAQQDRVEPAGHLLGVHPQPPTIGL